MEGHVDAVCPSQLPREFDEVRPAVKVENFVAFTLGTVFLDDPQRDVQQPDGRGRFALLAPYVYPRCPVGVSRDVFLGEPPQVGVGQPGEGGEDEPVAHTL